MSSAAKTLDLLTYFSVTQPEIGLSHLCRLAGRDKASTYRHLQDLENAGFVEQNPRSKHYRLGPALLQLAQTRETTVPRKEGVEMVLRGLANATGETSHASVLSGMTLYALASCESPKHSTRAIIDIQTFPLHATASGISALAFGPDALIDVANENLEIFTSNTPVTPEGLLQAVQSTRATGFGRSNRTFETDIQGISAPIFDQSGLFAGAVSVASVASRFRPEQEVAIQRDLVVASRTITKNWGGVIPAKIEALWAATVSPSKALETGS